MNESQLTSKILKKLKQHGGLWWKIHGGPMQTTGLPDIIGCYRGLFVGLEVKVPERQRNVSNRQRLTLDRIKQQQGVSALITSTEDALAVIRDIDDEADDLLWGPWPD